MSSQRSLLERNVMHDLDFQKVKDMLNNEDDTLRERVSYLEKKTHEQQDEIACLRSTLADLLRRVANLEGRATIVTNNVIPNHTPSGKYNKSPASKPPRSHHQTPTKGTDRTDGHVQNRYNSHTPSNLPIRRLSQSQQYQSNQSLHSDEGTTHSSTSTSPVPSPSPAPSHNAFSIRSSPSPRHTPSPNRTNSSSNLKKWSSNQDFMSPPNNLLNSTKDASYNADEGTLKMYLRGRPIILHAPSHLIHEYDINKINNAPAQKLKLDWVYGYRGRDCRNNLYLLPTGEMVYFLAAVVVLYDVEEQSQRHYLGHTDDIKCLAIHPNRLLIATGQVASHDRRVNRPHIRIWDSVSLNTLHVLGVGDFERSVCCLAFSKTDGGSWLCAVDDASEHNLSVWDWPRHDRGMKIAEVKSTSDTVLAVEFHPMDRDIIVSCGKGHICFWHVENGMLVKRLGIFEKFDKPKYVLCLAFTDMGDILTGDSNGSVLVWPRGSNRVDRTVANAHEGGVFTICVMKDGNVITGGGKDRRIIEWNHRLSRTGRQAELDESYGCIRMISQGKGNSLIVGTTRNCILQGTMALNFNTVVQGHIDELWGLATHPNQNQFLTGGYDKVIHLWDSMSHSVIWSKFIGEPVSCANFSPDGNSVVVGTTSGRWLVLDSSTREVLCSFTDGNEALGCIKFSPDGRLLALGSHDNHIYIYQVTDEQKKYNRIGRCMGHSSFITHLDWSFDSTYIQSNAGDYEILYWNAAVCRQVTNSSITRDIQWASQSCSLGFNVVGIWPEGADGSDINTCARTNEKHLLATGDDFGKVKLFCFPANQPKSVSHSYSGHSSHVTSVEFLHDDSRLISLGGKDTSIIQWTVSK
ncbi:Echinoderm microtubule-associated protein-like 1 [Nymphon striatum]|nr:Echinoderm microtubule-associated protein-like 1 [Nymphon striatum]